MRPSNGLPWQEIGPVLLCSQNHFSISCGALAAVKVLVAREILYQYINERPPMCFSCKLGVVWSQLHLVPCSRKVKWSPSIFLIISLWWLKGSSSSLHNVSFECNVLVKLLLLIFRLLNPTHAWSPYLYFVRFIFRLLLFHCEVCFNRCMQSCISFPLHQSMA